MKSTLKKFIGFNDYN